ncbi:IclR family transcriptional regulator [Fonticella tunisiensis]|uniref:Glycerol operon regulatory protein n=1 Tax=Fonticella tunisiensis TaxID=1096341 RepID=A0A4R7KAI8_9CLOT|nr:IclR family transcriptional regulator [Fonticella tunisiensis]TDT51031.1 IclR family transcriptional regulator [Fonticella tunisiensis]
MENRAKTKSNLIQSVDRALQILECFSRENRELGVTEISKYLGLHKSTTFGLLSTLESRGYVEQNLDNGKYRLGLKLFELGNLVHEGLDLRKQAYPFLKELVDKYQETVHLVVNDRGEAVYIDKVEGPGAIRMYSQVGKRPPMYCTGVGKAILAYMPDKEVDRILFEKGLRPFTPNTITDVDKLKAHLAEIREQGYSFDNEEIEIGLRCVAAPIKNHKGEVIAAISVAGPSTRMTWEKMNILAISVKEAAVNISRRMGYKGI